MRKLAYSLPVRIVQLAAFVGALLTRDAARADMRLPDIAAVNITDVLGNVQGGLDRGARVLDKADITATYAGAEEGGFSAFLDVQVTDATNFTGAVVGDAQGVSSLDAPAGLRLANAWAAWDFGGEGGVKAGILDLNTEFDVQATAALFLNSAFGIGPDFSQSGSNGPSIFPSTGLGLVGWWLPGDHWELKAGLFEGAPGDPSHPGRTALPLSHEGGALVAVEARNHLTPDFVLGVGSWRYTAPFDAIDPARGRLDGNAGFYAIADGVLYAAPKGENTGLSGWLRAGIADGRINTVTTAIGGGLAYTGAFGRKADQGGIAFARVQFGQTARRQALTDGGLLGPAETTLEATYSLNLGDHLTVQPDLQYVISPGGDPAIGDALVLGSRITATW